MIIPKNWSTMKKLMFLQQTGGGSVVIEDTVSGNPVVFTTDLAKPLKRLALSLLPRQSGTGDPSPSNIRPLLPWGEVGTWTGGKNLFDFTQTPTEVDCFSISGGSIKRNGFVIHLPSGVYTFSGEIHKSCYIYCNVLNADGTWVSTLQFMSATVVSPSTVTLSDGQYIVVFDAQQDSNKFGNVDIMLTIGSIATAYEPATITPHPVNLGKNLLDLSSLRGGTFDASAPAFPTPNITTNDYIPIKGGKTYVWSQSVYTDGSNQGRYVRWYNSEKEQIGAQSIYSTSERTIEAPQDAVYARFMWYQAAYFNSLNDVITRNPQIEEGSTPSAFQPYLPPVYGGTLDMVSGVLSVTHSVVTLNGSEENISLSGDSWNTDNTGFTIPVSVLKNAKNRPLLMCDRLKIITYSTNPIKGVIYNVDAWSNLRLRVFESMTVNEFKAWLSDNPVSIMYELATPLTYQLTPQQVSALVGVNTVWSDADNIDLTFLKKR